MDFFQRIIEVEETIAEENGEEFEPEEDFEVPPNLSFVEIDRKTGLLSTPFCLFPFREVLSLDYYEVLKKREQDQTNN